MFDQANHSLMSELAAAHRADDARRFAHAVHRGLTGENAEGSATGFFARLSGRTRVPDSNRARPAASPR